ncbi:MAG: phosphoenolpyruvate--protein phosphotransferase [Puniceicoccaceae bacterium]|nr:MAG: phosphoenolpyruvate--protein phosphotransferase [Puniceicoccaceae bacterium]
MPDTDSKEVVLHGIAASPGIAHGQIFVLLQKELEVPAYIIDPSQRDAEVSRFEQALLVTRQQIMKVQAEIARKVGEEEARIFDAHLLVLEDQALIEETIREMEAKGFNIEASFQRVGQRYVDAFGQIDDEYLRERASDIRDVVRRVLQNLTGQVTHNYGKLLDQRILVAHDITPSETATLDRGSLLGILTDVGSKTSHAVIVARSMNIPAVVGLRTATHRLKHDDWALVDGYDGLVIINPGERTLFRYGKIQLRRKSVEKRILAAARGEARTQDKERITLMANIEGAGELDKVLEFEADGVGLFRTEFLFLNQPTPPGEDEQFAVYREVASRLAPNPVIIRTLDLGGDKPFCGSLAEDPETNPFLGFRAIRYCLEHPSVFKSQLRAILRASSFGNVRLMFPMISGVDELLKARAFLAEVQAELRAEGVAFDEKLLVGSMIEIPSAAMTADIIARESDFFSIGTNDLIQYLLAIDRVNDRVAHLYEPTHPAVLRCLAQIIEAGRAAGIPVGICGEMAGDPVYASLLIGLGATEISVSPSVLPSVKFFLQQIRISDAKKMVEELMREHEPKAIQARLEQFYRQHMGELGSLIENNGA